MVVIVPPFMAVMIVFINRSMISVAVLESVFSVPMTSQMAIMAFFVIVAGVVIPTAVKMRPFPIISAILIITADMLFLHLIIMTFFGVIRQGSTCR
jgi:hypothetical protein